MDPRELVLTVDDLLDLLMKRRGMSRKEARDRLAAMPGGVELLQGQPLEQSPLADELIQGDPELIRPEEQRNWHGPDLAQISAHLG